VPVAQHDLCNHASRNRGKHVIAVHAHPAIPARRLTQSIPAIIIDYVLAITIVARQAVSAVPITRTFTTRTTRTAASRTVVRMHWHGRTAIVVVLGTRAALRAVVLVLILALILITAAVVALHGGAARTLLLTTLITWAAGSVLRERRGRQTQA